MTADPHKPLRDDVRLLGEVLVAGAAPSIRVDRLIEPLAEDVLDGVDIEDAVLPALPPHARRQYREGGIADASYRLQGIGRFRIKSKEENPKWVPPDWHYIEEAQKNGLEVVRLNRGQCIGILAVEHRLLRVVREIVHEDAMRRLFPRTRKVVVKDAGHWVHAQKPDVVVDVLRRLAA